MYSDRQYDCIKNRYRQKSCLYLFLIRFEVLSSLKTVSSKRGVVIFIMLHLRVFKQLISLLTYIYKNLRLNYFYYMTDKSLFNMIK